MGFGVSVHRFKLYTLVTSCRASDTTQDNQVLSNERAQMALAILTGDRESYKKLAHARHRISDVKQMLHWCVVAYPDVFTCDPGPIDDKDNTWNAVHTFEQQYNECKFFFTSDQPDLKLTGEMGPMNWGALFDVLQHNIAQELGVKVKEVAALREKIQWLDAGRKALGFSEHHPIDAVGADNYESQSNRRVELLFFKETDILPDVGAAQSDPANSEIYLPGVYARERFPKRPGGAKPHCSVRLLLHRPPASESPFSYRLVGSTGYEQQARPDEAKLLPANMFALEFLDIPLDCSLTLFSTSDGVSKVLFEAVPVARLLEKSAEHGTAGEDVIVTRETDLAFLDQSLEDEVIQDV
jgi:hypothetical protein